MRRKRILNVGMLYNITECRHKEGTEDIYDEQDDVQSRDVIQA